MSTKKEVLEKIYKRIQERTGGQRPCSLCGKTSWSLAEKYITPSASTNPTMNFIGGGVYPFATLVCTNCGNSHLLNLLVLGFSNLSELSYEEEDSAGK